MITFSTTSVGVLQVVGTLVATSFCVRSVNVLFFSFLTVLLNNCVVLQNLGLLSSCSFLCDILLDIFLRGT